MSYVCNVTDISFLPESMNRCGKEIVGIDLPEGCLGIEFNLLTVLRGGAGHGRSELSDGTESPGTISHTQEASYVGGPPVTPPPPADPADEPAPALAPPAPTDPAPARAACAQEPPPAASPPKAGAKEEFARAALRRQWQINLVVRDERCAVVCRTRTAMQFPAEFHLLA